MNSAETDVNSSHPYALCPFVVPTECNRKNGLIEQHKHGRESRDAQTL